MIRSLREHDIPLRERNRSSEINANQNEPSDEMTAMIGRRSIVTNSKIATERCTLTVLRFLSRNALNGNVTADRCRNGMNFRYAASLSAAPRQLITVAGPRVDVGCIERALARREQSRFGSMIRTLFAGLTCAANVRHVPHQHRAWNAVPKLRSYVRQPRQKEEKKMNTKMSK